MIDIAPVTAEEFAAWDDAEERRWSELVAGKIIQLEPPDQTHGRIVLNLSKAIASYVHERGAANDGYACFELGLIVARDPDTVRCPAISFFSGGPLFAELEKLVTETRPALIVEVASTADRRRNASARIEGYLQWGVPMVWMADPIEKMMHIFQKERTGKQLSTRQAIEGGTILPGFRYFVADVFADLEP